ncbi:MAG: RsmB/NOP family class I SAM-dependent RNA methyltransferase [Candidatus Methanofastidiosa archaeon]|nr:RsmB/NOP family class I SAM-dependent RNA methyltransferase [Candidatus Methanofastidiosa archaeon]
MDPQTDLSSKFYERYRDLYGPDFKNFLECIDRPLPESLRVNTLKATPEHVIDSLCSKGFGIDSLWDGRCILVKEGPFSIASTNENLQGMIYIQGVAEMAVAPQLGCHEGDRVWDMCAAPGGKTTHLAELMRGGGAILATDVSPEKIKALKNNIARLGVRNAIVMKKDARRLSTATRFDSILLDAPCTGSGVMRKDPSRKSSRTMKDIFFMQSIQKGLLQRAASSVKEGGILLYSTCSLEPEEDEMVVDWALSNLPLKLTSLESSFLDISHAYANPFGIELDKSIELAGRIHPFTNDTNGMFIARFKRI